MLVGRLEVKMGVCSRNDKILQTIEEAGGRERETVENICSDLESGLDAKG